VTYPTVPLSSSGRVAALGRGIGTAVAQAGAPVIPVARSATAPAEPAGGAGRVAPAGGAGSMQPEVADAGEVIGGRQPPRD
jgi:hypothetical protein